MAVDWDAVVADPRFQVLHRRKQAFLSGLLCFSIVFYLLLPVGAGWFPDLFRVQVWGVVNLGLLFALAEFVVAWLVAWIYSRRAAGEFDRLARELVAAHASTGVEK